MMKGADNRQVDEAVQVFVKCATSYLQLIEGLEPGNLLDIARQLAIALAELYVAESALVQLSAKEKSTEEKDEEEWSEEHWISEETEPDIDPRELYRQVSPRIRDVFGQYDVYWEVFNPYGDTFLGEKINTTLSDDLADIYADVKRVMLRRMTNFTWDSVEDFEIHWGYHLVDALRALHWLVYEVLPYADEQDD